MKNYNWTKIILSFLIIVFIFLGLASALKLFGFNIIQGRGGDSISYSILASTSLIASVILLRDILKEEKEKS